MNELATNETPAQTSRAMPDQRRSPFDYAPPSEPYLKVLYADSDVLAVAKPSGLLSVPGKGPSLADCVASRAAARYPDATIVHRLDLDTSGVIVLARHRAAHRHIGWQFEKRLVDKVYIARVWGVIAEDSGCIEAALRCDWPNRPKQMIDPVLGRAARTAWRVVRREADATRVQLMPETGRSHQLRVHMLSIGHPILGDNLYAHPPALAAASRLQLHAQSLSFCHPADGRRLTLHDACPF